MGVTSYSQVGEDLQIAFFLGNPENVHYIDVGCLWPEDHSNTFFFYERGGQGLCVDPNPTVADEYREKRPRDIFVNCGVGAEPAELTYHMHANPVFNTFSDERAAEVQKKAKKRPGRRATGTLNVQVKPLAQIVSESALADRIGGRLDLLSVDVEGLEADVIRGADFDALRPRLVVIEHLRRRGEGVEDAEIVGIMDELGYWVAGYTGHDLYFLDTKA